LLRGALEDAFTFAERDESEAGPPLRSAARAELDSIPDTQTP
jgi:hypothetical protein